MTSVRKTKDKNKKPTFITRMNILFFLVFLLFATIIFRLSFIQLVEGEKYSALAETYREKKIPKNAPRGLVKDANHTVLVNNKIVWTVTFHINEGQKQDYEEIASRLTEVLASPEEDKQKLKETILEDMDVGPVYKASKYIPRVIEAGVDINQKTRAYFEENHQQFPGVEVVPDQVRNYLYNDFMAQVIGYTRQIPDNEFSYYQAIGYKLGDRIGRYGLERKYEHSLRGTDGQDIVEVNSAYAKVQVKDTINPVAGNNLILTIDKRYQEAVEASLEKKVKEIQTSKTKEGENVKQAMAVVMNPKTGAILAMANYPRYDPNWFNAKKLPADLYTEKIMPFELNGVIRQPIAIGSTAKPLTVLMGLQEGVITPDTTIYDQGRILFDYRTDSEGNKVPLYLPNYGGKAHGKIDLKVALQKSSNVFMAEVALRLRDKYGTARKAIEVMRQYNQMFGLGVNTGIDLAKELPGNVNEEVPNFVQESIGQHDTFTVMQLAQYTSAVANNGYRMRPYLVDAIEEGTPSGVGGRILYKQEPEVLNKIEMPMEYFNAVKQGMFMVTQPGGTAYFTLNDLPIKVGAKTGTAQSGQYVKYNGKWVELDNSVLIGFAPYDDPEIAFAIAVPYGGGGSASGPIAKELIESYLEIYKGWQNPNKIPKEPTQTEETVTP